MPDRTEVELTGAAAQPTGRAGVYLIHFDIPYAHARHYTGWAADIPVRLAQHRIGGGARLMAVITDAGLSWRLARIWPGADRDKERRLKRSGGASRYCPLCLGRPIRTRPRTADSAADLRGAVNLNPGAQPRQSASASERSDGTDDLDHERQPAIRQAATSTYQRQEAHEAARGEAPWRAELGLAGRRLAAGSRVDGSDEHDRTRGSRPAAEPTRPGRGITL